MRCCDAFIRRRGVGEEEAKRESDEDADEQLEGEVLREDDEDASASCCKGGVWSNAANRTLFSFWILFGFIFAFFPLFLLCQRNCEMWSKKT